MRILCKEVDARDDPFQQIESRSERGREWRKTERETERGGPRERNPGRERERDSVLFEVLKEGRMR